MGQDNGMNEQAFDPLTRRAALQLGPGLFGLSLPGYLAAARAGQVDPARTPSCQGQGLVSVDYEEL